MKRFVFVSTIISAIVTIILFFALLFIVTNRASVWVEDGEIEKPLVLKEYDKLSSKRDSLISKIDLEIYLGKYQDDRKTDDFEVLEELIAKLDSLRGLPEFKTASKTYFSKVEQLLNERKKEVEEANYLLLKLVGAVVFFSVLTLVLMGIHLKNRGF